MIVASSSLVFVSIPLLSCYNSPSQILFGQVRISPLTCHKWFLITLSTYLSHNYVDLFQIPFELITCCQPYDYTVSKFAAHLLLCLGVGDCHFPAPLSGIAISQIISESQIKVSYQTNHEFHSSKLHIHTEDLSNPLASSMLPAEICVQLTSSKQPQNAIIIPVSGF